MVTGGGRFVAPVKFECLMLIQKWRSTFDHEV